MKPESVHKVANVMREAAWSRTRRYVFADGSVADGIEQNFDFDDLAKAAIHAFMECEEVRALKCALTQMLDDGLYIIGYDANEKPIFDPTREGGGGYSHIAAELAIEALANLEKREG